MIKEAYCSHEVSELLKEKGFDEECTHYYSYEDDELIEYTNGVYSRNSKDCHRCVSPTHQMACAWLREVHNMHIDIDPSMSLTKMLIILQSIRNIVIDIENKMAVLTLTQNQ